MSNLEERRKAVQLKVMLVANAVGSSTSVKVLLKPSTRWLQCMALMHEVYGCRGRVTQVEYEIVYTRHLLQCSC